MFSWWTLIFYRIYFTMCHTSSSNMRQKWRNCLFKMKIIKSKLLLEQVFFPSIKGHLGLPKGHLDNAEGQVKAESPPNQKLFLTLLIQIKKKYIFWKGHFLTKRPFPMVFLSEIGPGSLSNKGNVRAPIQFREEGQPQHLNLWFFLRNRPIYFALIVPVLLDCSNDTSWVFSTLKSSSSVKFRSQH